MTPYRPSRVVITISAPDYYEDVRMAFSYRQAVTLARLLLTRSVKAAWREYARREPMADITIRPQSYTVQ